MTLRVCVDELIRTCMCVTTSDRILHCLQVSVWLLLLAVLVIESLQFAGVCMVIRVSHCHFTPVRTGHGCTQPIVVSALLHCHFWCVLDCSVLHFHQGWSHRHDYFQALCDGFQAFWDTRASDKSIVNVFKTCIQVSSSE